jgi:hypothetical protein
MHACMHRMLQRLGLRAAGCNYNAPVYMFYAKGRLSVLRARQLSYAPSVQELTEARVRVTARMVVPMSSQDLYCVATCVNVLRKVAAIMYVCMHVCMYVHSEVLQRDAYTNAVALGTNRVSL